MDFYLAKESIFWGSEIWKIRFYVILGISCVRVKIKYLIFIGFLFPTILLAQSKNDSSEFCAFSSDSLLEVHYEQATNRCFWNIKVFYRCKQKKALKISEIDLIEEVENTDFCLPPIFSKLIVKIEDDVYAIVAYNWVSGILNRNIWVVKFDEKKKLHLAASFVTNYSGKEGINLIPNVGSNFITVQFQLSDFYAKHLENLKKESKQETKIGKSESSDEGDIYRAASYFRINTKEVYVRDINKIKTPSQFQFDSPFPKDRYSYGSTFEFKLIY